MEFRKKFDPVDLCLEVITDERREQALVDASAYESTGHIIARMERGQISLQRVGNNFDCDDGEDGDFDLIDPFNAPNFDIVDAEEMERAIVEHKIKRANAAAAVKATPGKPKSPGGSGEPLDKALESELDA